MYKKLTIFLLTIFLVLTFTSCGSSHTTKNSAAANNNTVENPTNSTYSMKITEYLLSSDTYSLKVGIPTDVTSLLSNNKESHEKDSDYNYEESEVQNIVLNNSSILIEESGVYRISGTIDDGQILVNAGDEDIVKIILDGVTITSSSSAPIFIKNASKAIIFLEDDSINTLEDSSSNEEKGTLLSKTDLSVTGTGTLNITSNLNDALRSNDGLIIKSGMINITSADDAIRGKDYLIIEDGTFTLNTLGDGLKSNNEDDEDKGYIYITGGIFNIDAQNDGIQAQTDLLITSGTFNITTADGSNVTISEDISAKAIKSDLNIIIDGGTFTINSAEDSIHSDDSIIINSGKFTISAGDDAIHSDVSLEINGGNFNITKSYEGLESAKITINNGYFDITSSDDGINAAGDSDSSIYELNINGGFIVVNAQGDGLDANGYINMSDGIVLVYGPTNNGNGAIDYDRTFNISGGVLLAVGSSGMAQAPSSSSTQKSVLVKFNSSISSGTLVTLKNSSNEILLTFQAPKTYQSLVFSSADFTNGTYSISKGGTVTGTNYNGVYKNPVYSGGSTYKSFTVSSAVTSVR